MKGLVVMPPIGVEWTKEVVRKASERQKEINNCDHDWEPMTDAYADRCNKCTIYRTTP